MCDRIAMDHRVVHYEPGCLGLISRRDKKLLCTDLMGNMFHNIRYKTGRIGMLT